MTEKEQDLGLIMKKDQKIRAFELTHKTDAKTLRRMKQELGQMRETFIEKYEGAPQ